MPTRKMTARWVETVRARNGHREEFSDAHERGLVLRVSPDRKAWACVFRVRGTRKLRRVTLGTYPAMSLADAREKAHETTLAASRGHDPAGAKRAAKAAPTFADLAQEYLDRHARTKRTYPEQRRMIERVLLPAWADRKAGDIKRRDVIELTDRIIDRGSPIMANRTFSLIRRVYNFGIRRELVEANPTALLPPPGGKEPRRERVLTEAEILAFWTGIEDVSMAPGTREALRLILATAQRPGEVVAARRDEFDARTGWWEIPGARTKNGRPHRVPLCAMARDILGRIPQHDALLFPSPRGGRPIERHALSRAVCRYRAATGGERWTPHDLRRTAASLMAGAGVERLVVRELLNHADGSVTATYDRHSFDREKRRAMEVWGRVLTRILDGESAKIVRLHA